MFRLLLLVVLALLALNAVGRWLRPRVPPRAPRPAVESARKCPECAAYVVGTAGCNRPACPIRRAAT